MVFGLLVMLLACMTGHAAHASAHPAPAAAPAVYVWATGGLSVDCRGEHHHHDDRCASARQITGIQAEQPLSPGGSLRRLPVAAWSTPTYRPLADRVASCPGADRLVLLCTRLT